MTTVSYLGGTGSTSASSLTISGVSWSQKDWLYLFFFNDEANSISSATDSNNGSWYFDNTSAQIFNSGTGCFGYLTSQRSDTGSNETITLNLPAAYQAAMQVWRVTPGDPNNYGVGRSYAKGTNATFSVTINDVEADTHVLGVSFLRSGTSGTDTDTTNGTWGSRTDVSFTTNVGFISSQLKYVTGFGDQTYNANYGASGWGALMLNFRRSDLPYWGISA